MIAISRWNREPIGEQPIEMVERKGIGHPDCLIDGIMEAVSRELCREYVKRTGHILHHNVDKGQICAGMSAARFGGGEITHPLYVLLNGQATSKVGTKEIPVNTLALKAAREYITENTRFLDIERDVEIESKINPGSADLTELFGRSRTVPLANDTSFGVGYAPMSELEKVVLETERMLNSPAYKRRVPAVGEDIKVMGLRQDGRIFLTVAAAFVSRFVPDIHEYVALKKRVAGDIAKHAQKFTDLRVSAEVNTGDNIEKKSVYITVSGLSAENGDSGSVGRGNRVNGVISPMRPMSLEATVGKNPVSHVGKLYNVLAFKIAEQLVEEVPGVAEAYVSLLSQIGKPINKPQAVDIKLLMAPGKKLESVKSKAEYITAAAIENVAELTKPIAEGKIAIF